jgi:ATP-binding cassette subfamily B protein
MTRTNPVSPYFETIIGALHLVWKSSRRWTIVNIILIFLLGVLPLAALYLTKLIIDTITEGVGAPLIDPYLQELVILLFIAGGIGLVTVFSRSLSELSRDIQSLEVTDAVFEILHAQSIAVDLEYYDDPEYQNTLHRAQRDAPYRPTRIVNNLATIGQNFISLVGIAGIIFFFNIWLGFILIIVALPAAFVRVRYSHNLFKLLKERAESERRADYYHRIMTDPVHAKELRIFNIGPFFRSRFKSIRSDLRERQFRITKNRFYNDFLAQGLAIIALFGTLGFIAFQAIQGSLTVGDTVLYFMAFQSGLLFLQGALFAAVYLYEDHLFIGTLDQFLAIEPKIRRPDHPRPVPEVFQKGITFHNVNYTYPRNAFPSLQNINFTIGPGEVVALVGENGSGKTTLIKLLCLLYQPSTGYISVDDVDLTAFDPIEWRSKISVIFQDYVKYQMPAWENIWMSNIDDLPDRELIQEIARFSGADEVINKLPSGYDTMLGNQFQEGHELSQGEWQRIALARAFLRDANLIILDEPSSSLDAGTEAKLFREIREFARGKSVIFISHRFSNVRIADRICVLEKGQIIEEGTHSELLRRGGKYAHVYREQTPEMTAALQSESLK